MKFFFKMLLFVFIILFAIGSIFLYNGYSTYKKAIEKISLYDKIAKIKSNKNYISINKVPEYYKNAIIAVEDHRFESHNGIDIIGICRAIINNIKEWEFLEGGSTITQQVAKNLYFIYEDNVINRKIAEILVAFDLEKNYSKSDILELYINTIYFGDGYYGIKEACKGYLDKDPKDMTLADATMMAGIPNAPSVYAPTANPDLTLSRQKKVISDMVEYNYLSPEEAEKLIKEIKNLYKNTSSIFYSYISKILILPIFV